VGIQSGSGGGGGGGGINVGNGKTADAEHSSRWSERRASTGAETISLPSSVSVAILHRFSASLAEQRRVSTQQYT